MRSQTGPATIPRTFSVTIEGTGGGPVLQEDLLFVEDVVNGAEPEDITGDADPEWTPRPDLVDGRPHEIDLDENGSVYFRRTIETDVPRRVRIAFGSDDAIKAWVDDELILASFTPRA